MTVFNWHLGNTHFDATVSKMAFIVQNDKSWEQSVIWDRIQISLFVTYMNSSNNAWETVNMYLKNLVLNDKFQHFHSSISSELGL
jgi:ABC-type polar amino acid transport system ATPase subunit